MEGVGLQQILHPLLLSVKTVGASAVLFLILGIPLAYLLSKKHLRFKWLLDTIVSIPLVFPPIAVGFLLLLILGREGFIGGWLYHLNIEIVFEFPGLVLAGFIAGLPLMVKPLQSVIEQFPESIKEASYVSGKTPFYTLGTVVLPSIKKSLIAALLIASARAMGEVGITLMLGGDIIGKTDTVSLAIYNAVFDGNMDLALMLSGILIVFSLIVFMLLYALENGETQ